MLALLGLKDHYVHDGRVVAEWVDSRLCRAVSSGSRRFVQLAEVFKQLNAPLGSVGRNSLVFANRSVTGNDASYMRYLVKIGDITAQRDSLAAQIKAALNGAAFNHQPVGEGSEDSLSHRARALIDRVEDLAEPKNDHDHGRFGE